MTSKRRVVRGAMALFLGAAGCGPPAEPSGTPGSMRAGGFVFCDPSGHCGESEPLPDGIAVDSVFDMKFDGYTDAVLVSANEARLRTEQEEDGGTRFLAMVPGPATVEARDPSDHQLIDTITLTLTSVAALRPEQCARAFNVITEPDQRFDPAECAGDDIAGSGLTISRGASLAPTVCVVPLDAGGTVLSGLLAGQFEIAGAAQLELHTDEGSRCATIGGLTLGDALVTVMAGPHEATFTVQVVP